ncbi:reprolysin-like metallopeptidase [Stenotrophomonas sp. SAU14A_NAIMI4_8]|uniref:reprolysin-like metallopeptidase n=1 Tax=Stenotrophomonas sp. SAU14A_NAIMI4_8 TaxID=2072409 RepID=UPI00131F47C0|nr:zinc-dependent metalloprotease family protein [Stenotrophomonas sp. SAU14A_NAIMI4_8]
MKALKIIDGAGRARSRAFAIPSILLLLAASGRVAGTTPMAAEMKEIWRPQPSMRRVYGEPLVYRLDIGRLHALLEVVPGPDGMISADVSLPLPLPEGGWSQFRLQDAGTLPPGLARRYPHLRSLRGEDASGRQVRLDLSSDQFTAKVWDDGYSWSIQADPRTSSSSLYSVSRRPMAASSMLTQQRPLLELLGTGGGSHLGEKPAPSSAARLRHDFRIAVVAGSAYTALFGGNAEDGLFGVMRTVNQINQIYETDLGVHFTLVEASDRLVLTDPSSDPFEKILDQFPPDFDQAFFRANVELLRRELGEEGYDVGHLLLAADWAEGGIGGSGVTGNSCVVAAAGESIGTDKGAAWSIHPDPVNDPVAILIVAHELGHQFGAWHTANGCGREDNPAAREEFAFEPGSGSTVMGYATTLCRDPSHQLQSLSDAYFHAGNLAQINSWLGSRGGHCAVRRIDPGPAPWIDPTSVPSVPTIPARTPFQLDAKVPHAAPSTKLRYAWEQMDAGSVQFGELQDDGLRPIFRSYPPQSSSHRSFPRLAAILGEQSLGPGEAYPQTSRDLHFRLTVRDQQGRTDSADATVRVVDTGQPFSVLQPLADVGWTQGELQWVRWQVAGTAAAPINCSTVSLDLSVDGGYHYLPAPLAVAVPNIGEAVVVVPALVAATARARVRARCDGNVFYAISPGDFKIIP